MLPEISTQQTSRTESRTRYWRCHGKMQERYTRRKQLVVPHAAVLIAGDMRLETRGIQVGRHLGNVPLDAPLVKLPDHQQNGDAAHRARSLANGRVSKAAARASRFNQFRNSRDIRADARKLHRHRFHEADGDPLREAGQNENVGAFQEFPDTVLPDRTVKGYVLCEIQPRSHLLEKLPVGAIAGQAQPKLPSSRLELCHRCEQYCLSLRPYEPSRTQNAEHLPFRLRAGLEEVGIHSQWTEDQFSPIDRRAQLHELTASEIADACDQ